MLTIRRLRLVAFVSFFLLVAASLAITFWALGAQRDDARVINLAGRQRMLIQKMTLEVLGVQIGANPIYRQTLHDTAHVYFEQTLEVLIAGGPALYVDETSVTLPPTRDPEIRAQLAIVRATWGEIHSAIHSVLQQDPQSAAFAEAVNTVERLSPILVSQMDQAVRLYESEARRKVEFAQAIQFGFLAIVTLLLFAVFGVTERRVLQPIARLRAAAERIGAGDLATPVAIVGLGEMDELARSLDEMRMKLSASAEAQTALLELSRGLLAAEDERAVAECAVKVAASALGTGFSGLVLADADGRLITRAVLGWPADFVGRFELEQGDASQTGYTVLHGSPVAVADYATETAFRVHPVVFEQGIVSGLSVPMVLEGKVVGAMLVHSRARRRFGDDAVRLLSLIANQTAVALDKVRSLASERRRADELNALRATSNEILAEIELPRLFQMILERAVALLDATGGDLGLYDAAQKGIHIVASHNMGQDYTGTYMQFGEGVMGRVAETREPLIVADYQTWEGRSPQYAQGLWHAAMAAPLLASGRLVGVIGVVDAKPERQFTDSNLQLLNLFAQQAALALERARLFEAEQRRREAAVALLEITQVASSSLQLSQVLKHFAQRTAQACQANRCTIFLLDDAGEFLQPAMSQFADGHADLEQWETFKATTADRVEVVPLFRDAIRERRLTLLDDAAHTDLIPLKWTQPFGILKLLVVPLVSHDRAIGLMALDHAEAEREFTSEQIDLALTVGGQVAASIENARLYAEAARRTDQLRVLHEASRTITSELHLDTMLQTLTETAQRLVRARYAALAVLGADGQVAQFHIGGITEEERQQIGAPPRGQGLLGGPLRDGVPVRLTDLTRDPRSVGFPPHHPVMKTFLGVPIIARGKVLGSLYLTDRMDGEPFTQEDENLVMGLAADAAIAIENARLFGEVQRLAVTDYLTGLHNRRALRQRLDEEVRRAQRYHHPLSVIMADIDHFKNYNDVHGHPQGDVILRQIADLLCANVRETDFVGRYGGEEFIVILPETTKAKAFTVAEKIRCVVHAHSFPYAETQPGGALTISLGIATFPDDSTDPQDLIQKVDTALYRAKNAGRNRVMAA